MSQWNEQENIWGDSNSSTNDSRDRSGEDLSEAQFEEADLRGCSFEGARLVGANFRKADLTGTNLKSADLRNARFDGATLKKTDLSNADLRGASFKGAEMVGTVLDDCRIDNVNFSAATMHDVALRDMDLTSISIDGATLTRVSFRDSNMSGITIRRAEMYSCLFTRTNLQEAKIQLTTFYNSTFRSSDLSNTVLKVVNLNETEIQDSSFEHASVRVVQFFEAEMTDVDFSAAIFRNVFLDDAKLFQVDFSDSNCSGFKCSRSKIQSSRFRGAVLEGLNFGGGEAESSDFTTATMPSADLRGATFMRCQLETADLTNAKVSGTSFQESDLTSANLRGIDLSDTDITGAILSRAQIDQTTTESVDRTRWYSSFWKATKLEGGQIGVNGIWAKGSDTAAVISIVPPGNSMKGANPEAILNSLRRARRLHGVSLALVLLGISTHYFSADSLNPDQTFRLPFIKGIEFQVDDFSALAIGISFGVLTLVKSFMSDALNGARYISTRDDAMTVATFPWALTRYTGLGKVEGGTAKYELWQSLVTRGILAFHPAAYTFFWDWGEVESFMDLITVAPSYEIAAMPFLLFLCGWIFLLSERFQRPLVFDASGQKQEESELKALREAIVRQSTALSSLASRLVPDSSEEDDTEESASSTGSP